MAEERPPEGVSMMLEKPPPGQLVGLLGLPPAAPPDESPEEGPGEPFPPPSMEPEAPAPPGRQWQQTVTIRISHLLVVAVALAFVGGFGFHAALFPSPGLPSGGSSSLAPAATAPPAGNGRISVSEDNDPSVGPSSAKVVLIEFSDFQCPFCRRFFQQTLSDIERDYINPGKVRFVYRDFPLDQIHPGARTFSLAAECAKEQGKWKEYHDKVFNEQAKRGAGTISYDDYAATAKQWASEVGLNAGSFNACLDSGKHGAEVDKDLQDGLAAGVTGTPTFYIGNAQRGYVSLTGAQPTAAFRQVLDRELAAA